MPSSVAAAAILVSAIAPFAFVLSTNICSQEGRTELADRARRGLAPELLAAVEVARVRGEDVHDAVEVVEQDPAGLAIALGAAREEAVVGVLQLLVDRVVDRLRLALGVAGADHEVVGVADNPAQVDHADVDRLL